MENKVLRNVVSAVVILVMAASVYTLPLLDDDGVMAAAKMKLNKKKLTITAGKTYKLKVKNKGKKKVTWKSSKKSVATVNKNGKVKAKKAGKTTITAKVGGKKFKCKVTVKYATGSKKKPAIVTDGVTVKTKYGTMYFKATILKNDAAIQKLKSIDDWSTYDQKQYDEKIASKDFIVSFYDVTAKKGFKGSNTLSGMDIINSGRVYDSAGKKLVNYDPRFGGYNKEYISNTSLRLNGGQSGKMSMGLYVPKGTTSYQAPIYTFLSSDMFWTKYYF